MVRQLDRLAARGSKGNAEPSPGRALLPWDCLQHPHDQGRINHGDMLRSQAWSATESLTMG